MKLKDVIDKNQLGQEISAYMWGAEDKPINPSEFNIFNLNPEKEIEEALEKAENSKINLYKMNFEKTSKRNSIFKLYIF